MNDIFVQFNIAKEFFGKRISELSSYGQSVYEGVISGQAKTELLAAAASLAAFVLTPAGMAVTAVTALAVLGVSYKVYNKISARRQGLDAIPFLPAHHDAIAKAYPQGTAMHALLNLSRETFEASSANVELVFIGKDDESGQPVFVRRAPQGGYTMLMKDNKGEVISFHALYVDTFKKELGFPYTAELALPFDDIAQIGSQQTYLPRLAEHQKMVYEQRVVPRVLGTTIVAEQATQDGPVSAASAKYDAWVEVVKGVDGAPDTYRVHTYFDLTNKFGQLNRDKAYTGETYEVTSLLVANKMARAFGPAFNALIERGEDPKTLLQNLHSNMLALRDSASVVANSAVNNIAHSKDIVEAVLKGGDLIKSPATILANIKNSMFEAAFRRMIDYFGGLKTVKQYKPLPGSPFAAVSKTAIDQGIPVTVGGETGAIRQEMRAKRLFIMDPAQGVLQEQIVRVVNLSAPSVDATPEVIEARQREADGNMLRDMLHLAKVAPNECELTYDAVSGNLTITNLRGVRVSVHYRGEYAGSETIDRPRAGAYDGMPDTGKFAVVDGADGSRRYRLLPPNIAKLLDDHLVRKLANVNNQAWGVEVADKFAKAEKLKAQGVVGDALVKQGGDFRGAWRRLELKTKEGADGRDVQWLAAQDKEALVKSGLLQEAIFIEADGSESPKHWQLNLPMWGVEDMPPSWQDSNMKQAEGQLGKLNETVEALAAEEHMRWYGNELKNAGNEKAALAKLQKNPLFKTWEDLTEEQKNRTRVAIIASRRGIIRAINTAADAPRIIAVAGGQAEIYNTASLVKTGGSTTPDSVIPFPGVVRGASLSELRKVSEPQPKPASRGRDNNRGGGPRLYVLAA